MQMRVYKASEGVNWFKAGFKLFQAQPFTFIFMHLFIAVMGLIAMVIPFLQIPAALITPFLMAGFYQAVHQRQQGNTIILADVTKPLFTKGKRMMLFRLGLWQLGAGIVLSVIAAQLFGDVLAILSDPNLQPEQALNQLSQAFSPLNVVLLGGLIALYATAFAFAVPLIYFTQQQQILPVIKASFVALYRNMAALSVYGLICISLILLCAVLSFIPILLVMPICYISFFVVFQAIFQPPEVEQNTPEPPTQLPPSKDNGRFDA